MDPNAVNKNLTVDDFDSLVTYADQSQWSTPDPSQDTSDQTTSSWKDGTYHLTAVINAFFTFNFEGPTIFVYGAAGPAYGSFEISLDGQTNVFSAYAPQNASGHLLFSATTLAYANHTLKVTNLGSKDGDNGGNQLLFDYLEAGVQLAPAGASITNTSLEETDSRLTFNGNWTTNAYNPKFSGGGSRYTQGDGASVSLSFHGSAIYIFGDKTDRHGLYTVTLDSRAAEQFNGISGCGGAFAHACEKTNTLAYFASDLDSELHTVTVRNIAGVNNSFFDLDYMVYTTPSNYAVRGYTSFISAYNFDPSAGTLTLLSESPTGANPSWITSHPTNKSILYAVNENLSGALQSFVVSLNGSLTGPIDQVSTGGNGPAFAGCLSTGQVAAANFGDGTGKIIPTASDPSYFAQDATTITFPPPDGSVSHPHMALQHEDEVLVPDLGADKIWRLTENGSPGDWKIQGFIQQPSGSGPRHIAIFNGELYTLHELDSTLTVQQIPAAPNGTSSLLGTVNITPPNPPAGAAFAAAEILIPPPTPKFPVPYIYVSNRNTGTQDPQGDTIAIYERTPNSQDALTLVTHVYTGLDQIRGMEFGLETNGGDEYLVAAGSSGSGGVIILKRTDGGRGLEELARNTDVATRTSFVWL